jgi:hypothetical protein
MIKLAVTHAFHVSLKLLTCTLISSRVCVFILDRYLVGAHIDHDIGVEVIQGAARRARESAEAAGGPVPLTVDDPVACEFVPTYGQKASITTFALNSSHDSSPFEEDLL